MLVGRTSERLLIDGLVAGARVGRGGVLVLTGEAGIGKTTLLDYAGSVAGEVRLLRAVGTEAEQDVPFGGLAQLLRPTPQELARIPAPQAQALGVALALRQGPVADRLAVGAAVLSLLVRYSEDRPLGVLVDDAHLLDRPSAEALAFACRRFLADSVFVIVAARSNEPSPLTAAGLPEVVVGGLDLAATAELAMSQDAGTTPQRSRLLHEVTRGNPLAVLELAHDPAHSLSPAPGAPVPVPMPAALTDRFGRRVASLGDDARAVLLLAAAAGGDLATVTRAASADGVALRGLADAERAGLITVGPHRIEFTHPLVLASVYALAYPDERRAAHASLADAVSAEDPDRRAWHRCESTLGYDATVADEMDAVAQRAEARGAHAVSATAYQRAARLSLEDGVRARRLLGAGEAAWQAGDGDWAAALVREAMALHTSPSTRWRGLGLQGDIAAHRGRPAEAHRLFVAAAHDVAAADPSQAVLMLAEAVSAGFFQGSAAAALAAAERTEHLLTQELEPAAAAVGTLAVGMARVLAGRSGVDLIREGVRLLDLTGPLERASVRPAWLMLGPLYLRESGAGRGLVRSALDEGRARSEVSSLPTLLFMIARDGATTDHWAAAEADYDEAIALARELGHTTELAICLAGLSWLEARRGRVEQCRAHAAETLELCATRPVNLARVWAEFALGELDLVLGDMPSACARLARLDRFLAEIDLRDPDLSPAPELAEALLRGGDADGAHRVATRYGAAADAKGLPWAAARAARLRGLLGERDDLDGHFAAALSLHAQTLDVFEQARTHLAYGARLRRARRRIDAREQLRAAMRIFERLGAHPWADAAAAELEATGESVPRMDVTDIDRLTPREVQIALLLAAGRTTRETAAALFLSPKTVEYHLRHVYTKFGISSRAELGPHLGDVTR